MSAIASNRAVLALVSLAAFLQAAGAFAADRWEPITVHLFTAPSPLPSNGTVKFPDERTITVTFRSRPTEEMKSIPLDQYPQQLSAAEQGDARAARTVGGWMTFCAHVRGVPLSAANTWTPRPIPRRKVEDSRTREVREFCDARSTEEIASGVSWLERAASSGDVEAMKALTRSYQFFSDERGQALQVLWQHGSIEALHELAEVYGWRSARFGGDSPDRILALAFYLLYAKLNESAWREDPSISAFIDFLGLDAERRLANESSEVRSEAIALAQKSLSENTRCCFLR